MGFESFFVSQSLVYYTGGSDAVALVPTTDAYAGPLNLIDAGNGIAYFFAADEGVFVNSYSGASSVYSLWRTDGTPQGTLKVTDNAVFDVHAVAALDGNLVFSGTAYDAAYSTDSFGNRTLNVGQQQNTGVYVAGVTGATCYQLPLGTGSSSSPTSFVAAGSAAYFFPEQFGPSTDFALGLQRVNSDGTGNALFGAMQFASYFPDYNMSFGGIYQTFGNLTAVGNDVYFTVSATGQIQKSNPDPSDPSGSMPISQLFGLFKYSAADNVVSLVSPPLDMMSEWQFGGGGTFANIDNQLYVFSSNGAPWKTDGTTSTHLSGSVASENQPITNVFAGTTKVYLIESGSSATIKAVDVATGSTTTVFSADWINLNTRNVVVAGDHLFFVAYDSVVDRYELYTSSGATATKLTQSGGAAVTAGSLSVVGTQILFSAYDAVHGEEIWVSDGTDSGTRIYIDATPGETLANGSFNPSNFVTLNGVEYFLASDVATGKFRLYRSDGTVSGTTQVSEATGDYPSASALFVQNGALYFFAQPLTGGVDLWTSDGSGATKLWHTYGSLAYFPQSIPGSTYFVVNDGQYHLWKLASGTSTPIEITQSNGQAFGFISNLTAGSDGVYFLSLDPSNGSRNLFWKIPTGATTAGIAATPSPSPFYLQANGSIEYYVSTDGAKLALYAKSSNTTTKLASSGTIILPLASSIGTTTFFAASHVSGGGFGLWKTDGTVAGTVEIVPTNGAIQAPQEIAVSGTYVYFTSGYALWRSDGTNAGTLQLTFAECPQRSISEPWLEWISDLLLGPTTSPRSGYQLYRTNGTAAGTMLASTSVFSAQPQAVFFNGTKAFFSATNLASGTRALDFRHCIYR